MKKVKKQIRNDILEECNIPDVLDKVKPYAIERAYEFREENKTVKLNFHRPAKILISCVSFAIVILIAAFIVPNVISGNNKLSFKTPLENTNDGDIHAPEGAQAQDNKNETPGYSEDPSQIDNTENFADFSAYYSGTDVSNKLKGEELKSYYSSVASCVDAGMELPEVKESLEEKYSNEEVSEYEESIEIIYNYLK